MKTPRSLYSLLGIVGIVMVAACEGAPTAATLQPSSMDAAKGGNSAAAHACQQAGYENLFRTDGTGFGNTGECVRYAAQGGTLATKVTITFSNVVLSACNALSYGYLVDGVPTEVGSKADGCATNALPDYSFEVLSTQTVVVYLTDDKCGVTYLEGGNHSQVGPNPGELGITDAGFYCEGAATERKSYPGNLTLTKTVS